MKFTIVQTRLVSFWLQKVFKILLQSVTLFVSESSSSLVVSDEIVNRVSGELEVIMFPRSTIFSSASRGPGS